MKDVEKQIIETLDLIRPFLISDGGDVEFVKYEDNIVHVRLVGACAGCAMANATLKDGIEAALKDAIPEIKEVINVG